MNGNNNCLQNVIKDILYYLNADSISAIIALIALIVTLSNIIWTNIKQKREEQKRNNKTLKMIDLATKEKTEELKELNKEISKKIKNEHKPDDKGLYYLHINNQALEFSTKVKIMVNLNDVVKYVKDNELHLTLSNYQETIKSLLINQHTNLNFETLKKITTRLEDIENTVNKLYELKTYTYVYNVIIRVEEDNAQEELKKYGELNELIEKLSKELYS